ncbi:MAG: glycosyltransferase [Planctomycetota bacterium]
METPIHTLHVDTERTWRGGEQQALYLALGLKARGHVAEVVGHPGCDFVHRSRKAGLTAHEVGMRGELNPVAVMRIARLLRSGRFQIIHAHTSHAHTLAALAASLAPETRCVVSRRVDFKVRKGRFHFNRIKYRFGVDRYLAISDAVREVLLEGGVPSRKIHVVRSGIDLTRLETADPAPLREEFGLVRGAETVGAVAHFAWHKGLEVLIDAIPEVVAARPATRFFLVGTGELAGELKQRARARAPEGTVIFPGFREDAPSFLRLFDVVAAPSFMEGLNTTNLDALGLARPVVASDVGGISEAVVDGVTRLLVPARDPHALSMAILRLLEDRPLARRLGEAGRRLVREKFSTDSMVEGTLDAYRAVLNGVTC